MQKRVILIATLCLFVTWTRPFAISQTASQPAHRPFRIGLLSDTTYFSEHATAAQWDSGEQLAGLRQGMKDVGIAENKDWILIPRIANRDHDLLDKYAAELVAMNVDVIAASSTTAALAARHATQTIPIVTWGAQLGEIVPAGPETNVTGFKAPDEIGEYVKQLQLVVPNLKRLAVLYDTSYVNVPLMAQKAKKRAADAGLEPILIEVQDNEPVARAFDRMVNENVQALLVLNHPRFHLHPEEVTTLALQYRIPMASPYRETAEAGGLIAHHPDWEQIWRRAAKVIKQTLDGTPPSKIPVQTGDMRYYINVKTANALGLAIPDSLRKQARLIGVETSSTERDLSYQETSTAHPEDMTRDEAAIRAIVADTAQAFNRQDAKGTVAHRTEDLDHINVAGVWATGKAQLEAEMAEYFKTHHPLMTFSVEKIRFLNQDAAYAVVKRHYKDEKGTRDAISTSVFQKINGQWLDCAFQNTFIQSPAQQTASEREQPATIEQEIKQLEEARRQAVLKQDVQILKTFYADGMTIVDIDGDLHFNTGDTSAPLNQPASRTTVKWTSDELTVTPYGDSAALVTMRAQIEDVLQGKHRDFTCRLMHVWIKRNGQWQIVARHGTEITAATASQPVQANSSSQSSRETQMRPAEALTPEQQEIFDFHRKLHDAHWRGDTAALKQLLTVDWFVANPAGQIIKREQFLDHVKAGTPPELQDEIRIRRFGDVAVMTLRTTWGNGRMQRGTEFFVKQDSAWKQAANQQTLVRAGATTKPTASNGSPAHSIQSAGA